MAKPVVFVIAHDGFQPIEYSVPKTLLERAGYLVVTASNQKTPAVASDGSTTDVDLLISEVDPNLYEGIFFIGGPGSLENLDNPTSIELIKTAAQANIILGAICAPTRILAKAGVLTGKRATGWNGDNELGGIFKEHGVNYKAEDVIVDGDFITAIDPSAAREFGERIISMLQDRE